MNIIKKLFTRVKEKATGLIMHPDLRIPIKEALVIDGVQYYECSSALDMPAERYLALSEFINQFEMGIDRETYIKYLKKQQECFNKGDITTAIIINDDLQRRATSLIELNIIYRLASVVFFNLVDNEDLHTYDYDYNTQKIEKFKQVNIVNFFLQEPLSKYLPLKDLSEEGLRLYSRMLEMEKERTSQTLAR